ncbi:hypothetical protein M501DRAFT_652431 [Patellaria atrata CBS 101060]|uniref:Apple domain-containing protein n=1 Tax=Patellaria atrata CBS 101060 TaxID=1346257 RepID=A0A9P4VSY8_9PEZI|nr:hypothetical protein M501DRAFT_652431 [Patellaria atrata CBS 101060]
MEARAVNQLPMYVSGYPPGQIKSACSCLSITPSTTTSTKTKTTLHKATTTVTAYTTVTTVTSTTTTTIEGPRPTVSTCYDYQNSPLNTGYEYLNINDTSHLTMLDNVPIFSRDLIDCCNLCYETPNCVVYRFNNDHSTATCQRWVTPGDEELEVVGYNEMCREGLVEGQRQPITEKDFFGNMAGAIAIGPCLVADWVN